MTLISVIGTGVGTLVGQLYREARRHRWDEEQRARIAAELASTVHNETAAIAAKLEESNAIAEHERRNRKAGATGLAAALGAVSAKLDDVHSMTADAVDQAKVAYSEANSVNEKIRHLTEDNAAILALKLKP